MLFKTIAGDIIQRRETEERQLRGKTFMKPEMETVSSDCSTFKCQTLILFSLKRDLTQDFCFAGNDGKSMICQRYKCCIYLLLYIIDLLWFSVI